MDPDPERNYWIRILDQKAEKAEENIYKRIMEVVERLI